MSVANYYRAIPYRGSWRRICCLLVVMCWYGQSWAQETLTREACVAYALENEPGLQALRKENKLAELNNSIALSAWKPQVSVQGNLRNNVIQQVSIFPDLMNPNSGETQEVEIGTDWVSVLGAQAEQLLYSPEIIRDLRLNDPRLLAATLAIEEGEIALKAAVNRAFYRTLQSEERIRLLETDLERLTRSLRDAELLFEEGINDKVDYKRATIARNQTLADLRVARLELSSRMARLKETMGYPAEQALSLRYDFARFRAIVLRDSLADLPTRERVELRALAAELKIQRVRTDYFGKAWFPTVSVAGAYNFNWQDNRFGDLYNRNFPNAFVALNLSVPLFQGGRRLHQLELAGVVSEQIERETEALRRTLERETTVAANDYRAARTAYRMASQNAELAREVYDVVLLQYREGIKPFLDVVIAETDLRTTRLAILDQLIQLMLARVELERVNGTL